MKISPCKDCIKRHIKCHSDCEEYKEWAEKQHEEKNFNKIHRSLTIYTPASERRHTAYICKHAGHIRYKKR